MRPKDWKFRCLACQRTLRHRLISPIWTHLRPLRHQLATAPARPVRFIRPVLEVCASVRWLVVHRARLARARRAMPPSSRPVCRPVLSRFCLTRQPLTCLTVRFEVVAVKEGGVGPEDQIQFVKNQKKSVQYD